MRLLRNVHIQEGRFTLRRSEILDMQRFSQQLGQAQQEDHAQAQHVRALS
jgi:hypothetical protein